MAAAALYALLFPLLLLLAVIVLVLGLTFTQLVLNFTQLQVHDGGGTLRPSLSPAAVARCQGHTKRPQGPGVCLNPKP